MPYRHAHYYLLLLLPLAFLAFWPRYFSDLRAAPLAFHVHGLAGTRLGPADRLPELGDPPSPQCPAPQRRPI